MLCENNKDLLYFAKQVSNLFPQGYPQAEDNWWASTMTVDILDHINSAKREDFLKNWIDAVEDAFGKLGNNGQLQGDVANKLKAAFGEDYTEALSDIIYRMRTGRVREFGRNRIAKALEEWTAGSVGAVMFFNTRTMILQQLSIVNFMNYSDNNPFKVGEAFANQKQFWADFSTIWNSDFIKQRMSGIKLDVNADEIAKAAETGNNKARAALAWLLKKGFLPTSIGDAFAISFGGASFYRNRVNSYIKQGLNQQQAEEKAFLDFKEIAEETQQSSRPDRISQQQASVIGRIILNWANTPMQYSRIMKKRALDIVNRRGDWKEHMAVILYYGALQNVSFSVLQSGLFAVIADDDEELSPDEERKIGYAINSSIDTLLRGMGYGGAVVSTIKNVVMEAIRQEQGKKDHTSTVLKAFTLSPVINSKLSRLMSAKRAFTWKQEREKMRTEGLSLSNPAFEAVGQVISATTNAPIDRIFRKLDNLNSVVNEDYETWQEIALALGWNKWDVGIQEQKPKKKKKKKPSFGIKISTPKF